MYAIMMHKLKLEGDISEVLRYARAALELVWVASRTPTEFII